MSIISCYCHIEVVILLFFNDINIMSSIDNCYNRVIERFKNNNKDYTENELTQYQNKKKGIYIWYKQTNSFLNKIDKLVNNTHDKSVK